MPAQPEGFNPLRWSCDKDGCFNQKRRQKIEVFAVCFPRRINFGDIDGMVELNNMFCFLEWKGAGGSLRRGQILSFMALSRVPGCIVFIVHGDAETMAVRAYELFWQGSHHPSRPADLTFLKERIKAWADWANGQAVIAPPSSAKVVAA